jgi:putative endonuclease
MSLIDRILRRDALTRKRGAAAEDLAAAYLQGQGVRILARNYRIKGGEIDLVGHLDGELLFIEVRLRSRGDFGDAAASITRTKQRRLRLAAAHYLQRHGDQPCRFDCVLLDRLDADRIEWMRDAFRAD